MYITLMKNDLVRLDPKNCKKIIDLKTKQLFDFVICSKSAISDFADYFENE